SIGKTRSMCFFFNGFHNLLHHSFHFWFSFNPDYSVLTDHYFTSGLVFDHVNHGSFLTYESGYLGWGYVYQDSSSEFTQPSTFETKFNLFNFVNIYNSQK